MFAPIPEPTPMKFVPEPRSMVAITKTGFVEGAYWSDSETEKAQWISDMRKAGLGVVVAYRPAASKYLFETIPLDDEPRPKEFEFFKFERMLAGRKATGVVAWAGWDCAETRETAKEWIASGQQLEFISREQVQRMIKLGSNIFATWTPVGDVLSGEQLKQALASD